MKKTILILAIIVFLLCIIKKERNTIPTTSIRFRVLANSNISNDQEMKQKVVENILKELKPAKNFTSIWQTRTYLQDNIPNLERIIASTLEENNIPATFNINYGKNWFPEKTYEDQVFEEGEYESLVITLGKGEGDNFWCVLFPPICFLDEREDVEYKSWLKELIDKYF